MPASLEIFSVSASTIAVALGFYFSLKMPGLGNLAKPFAIAGFILAEIYMLFTVLGPYGHEPAEPLPDASSGGGTATSVPPEHHRR